MELQSPNTFFFSLSFAVVWTAFLVSQTGSLFFLAQRSFYKYGCQKYMITSKRILGIKKLYTLLRMWVRITGNISFNFTTSFIYTLRVSEVGIRIPGPKKGPAAFYMICKVVSVTEVERCRVKIERDSDRSTGSLYAFCYELALRKIHVLVQISSIFPARSPADQMCPWTNSNMGTRLQARRERVILEARTETVGTWERFHLSEIKPEAETIPIYNRLKSELDLYNISIARVNHSNNSQYIYNNHSQYTTHTNTDIGTNHPYNDFNVFRTTDSSWARVRSDD